MTGGCSRTSSSRRTAGRCTRTGARTVRSSRSPRTIPGTRPAPRSRATCGWATRTARNARRVFDCAAPCIEAEDPAWSPDGRTLAFVTWGPQPASLALLDVATGSVTMILTVDHDPDGFRGPRWSPDGRRIVLEHQTWTGGADDQIVDTAIGIVDLDAPTPEFTPITKPDMWATYPDWHPTEDRIVFSTRPWTELPDGPSRLYTIRPDGTELTPLTPADDDGSCRAAVLDARREVDPVHAGDRHGLRPPGHGDDARRRQPARARNRRRAGSSAPIPACGPPCLQPPEARGSQAVSPERGTRPALYRIRNRIGRGLRHAPEAASGSVIVRPSSLGDRCGESPNPAHHVRTNSEA